MQIICHVPIHTDHIKGAEVKRQKVFFTPECQAQNLGL